MPCGSGTAVQGEGTRDAHISGREVCYQASKGSSVHDQIRSCQHKSRDAGQSSRWPKALRLIIVHSQVLQYSHSDFIQDSGMQISTEPVSIKGKVLSPPDLLYGQEHMVVSFLFLQWICFRLFLLRNRQMADGTWWGKHLPALPVLQLGLSSIIQMMSVGGRVRQGNLRQLFYSVSAT
jgi:hypothetical protein